MIKKSNKRGDDRRYTGRYPIFITYLPCLFQNTNITYCMRMLPVVLICTQIWILVCLFVCVKEVFKGGLFIEWRLCEHECVNTLIPPLRLPLKNACFCFPVQ